MNKLIKFIKEWFWTLVLLIAIGCNFGSAIGLNIKRARLQTEWFPIPTAAQQQWLVNRGHDIPVDGLGGVLTDAALLAESEGE